MKYTRDSVKNIPIEMSREEQELFHFVKENDLSMTSNERLFATIMACRYAVERDIPGDFVECGVWRGCGRQCDGGERRRAVRNRGRQSRQAP